MRRDDYMGRMEHACWDDEWDDKIEQKMAEDLYGDWLDIMTPEQADMYYTWACDQEDEEAEREADALAQAIAERTGAA